MCVPNEATAWSAQGSVRCSSDREVSDVAGNSHVGHDWHVFIKPEELARTMARHGLIHCEMKGIRFAGFRDGGLKLKVGGRPRVAYIGYARKSAPMASCALVTAGTSS